MRERGLAAHGGGSRADDALDALVDVSERERAALASSIHDGPVQTLTAASLRLQSAAHFGDLTPELAAEVVESIADAAGQLRRMMSSLGSWWVHGGDLDEAIERYVAQLCSHSGVEASVELEPLVDVAPRHAVALFRVVQEAVENALQHSRADRVEVRLARVANEVVLQVSDAGSGFDPETVAGREHVGLELMRRRVEALGGKVSVYSAPGAGTSVRAIVPAAR